MNNKLKIIKSSAKDNFFFKEEIIETDNTSNRTEGGIVNIFDDVTYQEVLGFGGAFTESAAYNYSLLNDAEKDKFMKAYFDDVDGIGYNFGRTHINSCDFSLDIYTYVEEGDETLETFDISRDKKYIIPFIKDAQKYMKDELVLFASPWSPPAYMKDNNSRIRGGKLLDKYKELWALYYAKYIKAYRNEGIDIKAISIQNEPFAVMSWESCSYSAEDEAELIEKYIIPVFDREGLSDIKIIIWDHNKERVYTRSRDTLKNPVVNERVWGVGHHWYTGDHFDGLRIVHEKLNKPVLCTEFCCSINADIVVSAERYAHEMAGNFNNYDIASCDWNLLLSNNGGPFHNRNDKTEAIPGVVFDDIEAGCYAPILYNKEEEKTVLTPIYYYIGHFSKFVKRGAKRIAYSSHTNKLDICPFINPDGTRVVIILNCNDEDIPVILRHNDVYTRYDADAHTIMTILF